MKATMHDELMREAGFETDYHRELARRREQRRRTTIRAAVRAGWLLLIAAGIVELWARFLPGLPKWLVVTAVTFGALVQVADFVKSRLWPWMEDQI